MKTLQTASAAVIGRSLFALIEVVQDFLQVIQTVDPVQVVLIFEQSPLHHDREALFSQALLDPVAVPFAAGEYVDILDTVCSPPFLKQLPVQLLHVSNKAVRSKKSVLRLVQNRLGTVAAVGDVCSQVLIIHKENVLPVRCLRRRLHI